MTEIYSTWFIIWLSVSIILGITRLLGHKSQSFQAIAHLVVGGFFAVYFFDHSQRQYLTLGIGLSILEIIAFIIHKRDDGRQK